MLRLQFDRTSAESLVQQAREQIVSALHLGRTKAGDRLPSIRSLSRSCSIDTKTAFRIYHALAEEGYVELRRGSGAYVKETTSSLLDQARALAIFSFVREHVTLAKQLGLDPHRYAEYVARYAEGRKAPKGAQPKIGFVECNVEQVDVIAQELSRRTGAITEPILLAPLLDMKKKSVAAVTACKYLVTTDYHFQDVEAVARRLGKHLYCVRLDPRFLENLLALAERGILGMVVSDASFLPQFRRSIMRIGLGREAAKRIEAVPGKDRERVSRLISRADALYVSPLCAAEVKNLIPRTMHVLQPRAHISTESIDSIRALLLFGETTPAQPR